MQLAFTHLRWAFVGQLPNGRFSSSLTKQAFQPAIRSADVIAIEGEMNIESYVWETIN